MERGKEFRGKNHCIVDAAEDCMSTEFGVFPSDWALKELRQIAEPITQTAGSGQYETVSISAGIGFVNQAQKFGKELSGKQYEKYTVLSRGDFSYNKGNSNRYPQGCIYRLKDREQAAVPNVFESFRIVNGSPDYYEQLFISGFLNHQLYRKINHGVRDDGLLNLTERDFYSCMLPVPPLHEQERIAEILSACDEEIELYRQKTAQLIELKKFLLGKLFPSKGKKNPEIRFPCYMAAWEQRKLGELCSEFKSGDFIRAEEIADTGSFPVYGGNGLRGYTNRYNHDGDFALIGRQGALCGNMKYSSGKAYFTEHAVAVKADKFNDTRFLFYYLGIMNLGQYSGQSAQPGLAVGNLIELETMVPAKPEQECISASLTALDHLITLHQRMIEAQQQRESYFARLLLTGTVRVGTVQ